jgi:hypothetical protein
MQTGCNIDLVATEAATPSRRWVKHLKNKSSMGWRIFAGLLVWFSFIKLPSTVNLDVPQPWESVLSFAIAHHLQWGRDIVFTYGPLGFLTSDYYWGGYFWPILIWSFGFSLLLTIVLLRFLERVILPIRIALYVGLLLLTIPRPEDLGIDPICLFAITLFGVACLPEERPGILWLMILGAMFGLLSLIKFTYCLYGIFALLAITATHLFRRRLRPAGVVLGSSVATFLVAWKLAGQNISNIGPWLRYSMQIASGYSSAMSMTMNNSAWVLLGVLTSLCLIGLMLVHWCGSGKMLALAPQICLLAAGIFLSWKEGFVRAEPVHVVVFQFYAFILATTMPALLPVTCKRNFLFLSLTAATLVFALAPFALPESTFLTAIRVSAIPKLTDTVTALFMPVRFKHRLEAHLESWRRNELLPQIPAIVGHAPVGVLNYDQKVAILNGLNFRPHPVFQCYSAYTPELQRLNSDFFDSEEAPEYVLWRYGTIDQRFPTLDDGRIILRILDSYSPVAKEGKFVLWKRNALRSHGYSFVSQEEISGFLDQWVPVRTNATWLRIELRETWFGAVKKFLYRASIPAIEIRLENGRTMKYLLPPGNASSGFIVNPLLDNADDLLLPFSKQGKPVRVTAVRVSSNKRYFDDSVRFVMEKIEGVPALQYEPDADDAPVIPAPSPATAP